MPNRLTEQRRFRFYSWNPGPRREKEGAIEKHVAGKWHIIALQEATDAERLEEEATSAEADSKRRLALKRKAENELDDSGDPEVEDSVMNSLAKLFAPRKRPRR